MRKVYVRELKPYSLHDLAEKLAPENDAQQIVDWLMERNIIRPYDKFASNEVDSSFEEEAGADSTETEQEYQFRFVGMAIVKDNVLIVYPKYFRDREPDGSELKQIFQVLKRDGERANIVSPTEEGYQSTDRLPLMLALLDLYSEYGEYSNYVDGLETNGGGLIEWNRTIGNHLPMVVNDEPIYVEYESRKTFRDESDFITRLHRAVLTECSAELADAGVTDLLSLDEVRISDEPVDDLGDLKTLEWRLERERGIQFIDWKISILDLLTKYLRKRSTNAENNEIKVFGTTSFYHLWEEACKVAFGDKLHTKLGKLDFKLAGTWKDQARKELIKFIPHPQWERYRDGHYADCTETDTLIPDTITFTRSDDGHCTFCIYDAKYYVPSMKGKMRHQPGVESVTKQFLYQAAYRRFIKDYKFDSVYNAFLVPSSSDTFSKIARVSFSEVMGWYEAPFNNYIDMWALPAHKVFDSYLWDKKISDDEIKEISRSENQTDYASVVEHYMQKHLDDSPIIQKLHQNRLLSEEEFNKLERIFTHDLGSKDDYEHAYGSTPFGLQVRKFVKIDRKFVEQEFSHFFESNELSELQIDCVHEIENYIVENGYMELSALHQSPFEESKSFSRLFNEQLRADLLFVIDEITENAMEPQA